MGISSGDPALLRGGAASLRYAADDLAHDATRLAGSGHRLQAAAPGQVGELAETASAALGGAVTAAATLVEGLAQGAIVASEQLERATGGGH